MKLENKRILITGASSGIGLELVHQLLQISGVQVVGVARNIKTLENIDSRYLFPLSLDVTLPENVEIMINESGVKMGGIDIVICRAGFAYYEQFENCDYGHISRIYETNVLSPLYTLEKFIQKTSGKISFVVLSSALGKFGLPGYALYCSTKYALDGFHDSFHFEPHKRLHFMTVYPIGVKTNFYERIHTDMPLPRPFQSADITAKTIINGLKRRKHRVYTSKAFLIIFTINRVLPFLVWSYQKFQQYIRRRMFRLRVQTWGIVVNRDFQ
ncbi:MAG: SDR family NAD(P)-dependent oxidoreductase [Oscillospiraceae bacterium]|nr:SDR family NAD(P)-dependent oxidoreductase [Oscillospiraceae bacterium]